MDFIELVAQTAYEASRMSENDRHESLPLYPGVERITAAGERTLWVVFAIMAAASVLFLGMTFRQQAKSRIFHYITFFITATSALSYYGMATGGGVVYVIDAGPRAVRQVFWARYVDWAITTPLLLLDMTLLAGLPGVEIVLICLTDVGMVLTGLFAGFDSGKKSKWGYYAFSCLFFLYIVFSLLRTARKTAYLRSDRVGKLFTSVAVFSMIVWALYHVAFALSGGSAKINTNQEVLFYGILDILAKPVFGAWLLIAQSSIAESNVVLPTSWTESRGAAGGYGALSGSVPAHE